MEVMEKQIKVMILNFTAGIKLNIDSNQKPSDQSRLRRGTGAPPPPPCVVAEFCMNTTHPGGRRADDLTACAVSATQTRWPFTKRLLTG